MIKICEQFYARALQETDIDGPYPSWFEDQEVCAHNSHGTFFRPKTWFREFILQLDSNKMLVWALCHESDGHVGNIALQNISLVSQNAELAIILGDRRHWKKGLGFRATRAMCRHGFDAMNLHRIYCGTADSNTAMKRIAEKVGMRREGVRRQHVFLRGAWEDIVEYGLLRADFRNADD